MKRHELVYLLAGTFIVTVALMVIQMNGLVTGHSQISPQPTPTRTFTPAPPTPTDTPEAPTPTDTPVPPTNTPAPPTPTFTPVPPTPTHTPVPPTPNASPICTDAVPGDNILWPPDHKLHSINVQGVIDSDGDAITVTIDGIFQDEPTNAPASGSTSPDGQGVGSSTAEVRAERAGSGNGRVYHIYFTSDDGHNGACSGEILVRVPKNQGKKGAAVDDGPLYDSTIP